MPFDRYYFDQISCIHTYIPTTPRFFKTLKSTKVEGTVVLYMNNVRPLSGA